jgi:ABC-2 type transport system permease protein
MIYRIAALIKKELLAVFRDRRVRISIILPPIIQLLIFAYAATLDVKNVAIGVLNRDSGEQAFELVQRFHGSPFFRRIVYLQGVEEIAPFLDTQKGVMVLSIDEQFSRDLDAGKPADVQLLFDGRKSNTAQIVASYTNSIIMQFNQDFLVKASLKPLNSVLMTRNWYNPNLIYLWYNIPSLVSTLTMLACLVVTTQTIARERELGTFDQLLVSPLSTIEILLGKMIPGIIVGMVEGSLMLFIGIFLLQVPFTGSLLLFYLSQLIFVFSISGVGLFISSLAATQQQAMLGTFVFMTPSILLSGFATPVENMPTWLQPIAYLIPLKYMLLICKGLFLKAMPAKIVLNQLWPMACIALFTQTAAALLFRRRLE